VLREETHEDTHTCSGLCFIAGYSGTNALRPALDEKFKIAFSQQATIEEEALTVPSLLRSSAAAEGER